jgi:hypothetical protein
MISAINLSQSTSLQRQQAAQRNNSNSLNNLQNDVHFKGNKDLPLNIGLIAGVPALGISAILTNFFGQKLPDGMSPLLATGLLTFTMICSFLFGVYRASRPSNN